MVKVTGPLLYEFELVNTRHVDSVRRREEEITSSQESHPLLLGSESVSEPVEGTQTNVNYDHFREPGESSVSSSNPPLCRSICSQKPSERFGH